ncbi:ABC-F family ATP-binding cassette domain-containing protein [Candidatus Uhrbacteria bacterium]|nr:ABC-F family ATP-binding cassette domain-containing protein [Candidatus Uhrbacteria bacterium]
MGKIPRGIPREEFNQLMEDQLKKGAPSVPAESAAETSEAIEIPPELRAVLGAHVVDIRPQEVGRHELARTLTDAAVGAAQAHIGRTDPAIDVRRVNVARGKSKVLIGPNGAGKSTFFDALMERGAHMDTRSGDGTVVYARPVAHVRENLRIARLDQEELLGTIENLSAGEVLQSAARYFKEQFPIDWNDLGAHERNLANQDVQVRIDELLGQIAKLFDMEQFLNRKVRELSGGERTKMALMMVLASEPDALLLDEPTNHLDLRSIAKLTGLFDKYKREGVAVVSVSHVDWFLTQAGEDGVIEIDWDKDGRTLQESNAPYRRYVKDTARERVPVISGEVQWPQEEYGYKHGASIIETPHQFTVPNSPLRDIAAPSVRGGDLMILSGDNGTGKTKLMEAMARGTDRGGPKRFKGTQIAYLPQFWPEEIARGTLGDFFQWVKAETSPHSTGSSLHKDKPPQNAFVELARDLNFGGSARIGQSWLNRPFSKFSGGEQRLLWFLAVSALRDVDMLALDEPTNHMDSDLQDKVTRAIQDFPGAVMLSTHDRNLMSALVKEGGRTRGIPRFARHVVLERSEERTKVTETDESPIKYMERVMKEAKRQAQRLKI